MGLFDRFFRKGRPKLTERSCLNFSPYPADIKTGWLQRLPDILLLASNLAILFISGGDCRIFLVSIVTAITIRYLLLSVLIFLDWLLPGWFEGSLLRRMVKDPSEGGAYEGGGAETPVFGHFIFLAIFGYVPLFVILKIFNNIPLSDNYILIICASALMELRDIAVGRVIYFKSGEGQCRNVSWNFTQLLALALTMLFMTVLVPLTTALWILHGILNCFELGFEKLLLMLLTGRGPLWILSICLLGAFHTLLFLNERDTSAKNN